MPGRLGEWVLRSRDPEDPYTPAPRSRNRSRRLSMNSVILPAEGTKRKFRTPVFTVLRLSVYGVSLLWTIICFAIAVHFHQMLQQSDLTHFVPLAIFICVSCLLILLALIGFSFRRLNPITTRIEMGCLALGSLLWMILAGVLFSSDAADADVECYASESQTVTIEMPGFNTETYEAQYRVLEAFSIFNILLLLGFLIFLVLLSLRHHLVGNTNVWTAPVTAYPWFTNYTTARLPGPVTARHNSQSSQDKLLRRDSEKTYGTEKRGRPYYASSPENSPYSTPASTPRAFNEGVLWMPTVPRIVAARPAATTPPSTSRPTAARPTAVRHAASRPAASGRDNGASSSSRTPARADKFRRDASPRREPRSRPRDKYARDASPRR